MKKRRDWVQRFEATVKNARAKPFAWNGLNCATFVCDCIEATTGVDPMAELRGKVSKAKTKKEAFALLKKYGKGGIVEAAMTGAAKHGIKEIAPAYAKRGDPVVAHNENGEQVFGVVDLSGRHVIGMGPDSGIAEVPVAQIDKAWSIP